MIRRPTHDYLADFTSQSIGAVFMKAFLLAAGLGTRLHPITETTPKCLVPVGGHPLLSWWLVLLQKHGITDVLINLHHLPDEVRRFTDAYRGPLRIHPVMESALLGSAGTLSVNRDFVEGEEQFLILYADNLTDVNLGELLAFNRENPAPLTVGLFHAENPRACGIAELDDTGMIRSFVEKPEHPQSDLASAGMFVGRSELLEYLRPDFSPPYDFGGGVMPELAGNMNGMLLDGYLRDIGTHENLSRAEQDIEAGLVRYGG